MGRRLFAFERLMLGGGRPYTALLAVRVHGALSPDRLAAGLATLQARHPQLRWRLADGRRPAFADDPPAPSIPVRVVARRDGATWAAELERELAEPLDRARGPLARMLLVSGEEASELVLVADHVICDGRSSVILMRDLLLALSGGAPAPLPPAVATLDDLFGPEPPRPLLVRGATRLAGPIVVRAWLLWYRRGRSSGRARSSGRHGPHYVLRWDLGAEAAAAFKRRCVGERVSPFNAIAAAILRATLAEFAGDERFAKLIAPVDLRPFFKLEGENLLFPLPGHANLTLPAGSFWEQARAMRAQLRDGRAKLDPARTARLAERLHGAIEAAVDTALHGPADRTLAFSHYGDIDLPAFEGVPAEALLAVGEAPWAASTAIVSVVSRGCWHFSLVARDATLPRETASRIVERIEGMIAGVSGMPGDR